MIGEVKLSKIEPNRDGLSPVRMIQVVITEDDDAQDIELYQPTGEDSIPPAGARYFIVQAGRSWKIGVAADDATAPASDLLPGEKEIYASSGGVRVARIRLKTDGAIEIDGALGNALLTIGADWSLEFQNPGGSIKFDAAGRLDVNDGNLTVDP